MLRGFWDSQGPVLEHYQERGSTMNSACYCEMLSDRLKTEIRSKCRGQLSKGIVLLHDNARPHTAARTVEAFQKPKFEALAHPPYSPDLAPSDYRLFGPIKEALWGRRFTSDQELNGSGACVARCMRGSVLSQKLFFFPEGI